MARPIKDGLDYFPLDVVLCDKFELIEAKHGLVGFAVIIKILQKIYSSGYYYKWGEKEKLLFSKRNSVDPDKVDSILKDSFEFDMFDKSKFDKYNILTSRGIQLRFKEAVLRRKNINLISEYIYVDINFTNENINIINVDGGTQSKVKESKVKERNGKYIPEIKNFVDDFIKYISDTHKNLAPKNTTSLFKNSYDCIEKLIRVDNFELEYIREVLKWAAKDAGNGSWSGWSDQVKSLAGLRKKKESGGLTKFQKIVDSYNKQKNSTGDPILDHNLKVAEEFLRGS